jgi:hypothetical protein
MPAAAQEGRDLCWPARRRYVAGMRPQPRPHRRRRRLELGRRRLGRAGPRRPGAPVAVRRRSKRWLASALSLCLLGTATASPRLLTGPCGAGARGGDDGRLGHGDEQGQWLPELVAALAGRRVIAVSAGPRHTLANTADGAVWSWGYGYHGQLGHGDRERQFEPKKIEVWASRPPTPASSDGEGSSDGERRQRFGRVGSKVIWTSRKQGGQRRMSE